MADKILVVDDERDLVELLEYNLRKDGYTVVSAGNGLDALKLAASEPPDLVVLDIMLPGMQGLDVMKGLKGKPATQHVPVILLTARSDEFDRVLGLELGADDYVTKPFSPRELIARVKAVLRRSSPAVKQSGQKVIVTGGLRIDLLKHKVYVNDNPVELSPTEFKLIKFLAENRGRVISRESLLDNVWGHDAFVEPRTVDVHVRRLRAKIEDDPEEPVYIKTVRGVGYEFGG
ncbi:MAG: winged helix-turn-helix domain-containing protein [Nitrospirae bacterium]|nr:winged helix-turn-helix domain-containing protein [Nitrospirota bacterium]MBI5694645.1 winged helix-turn-helix domain-containing protein [Nitrospirota bacterium]